MGSFKLLEIWGIFGSPARTLLAPYNEASISPNFEDQLSRTNEACTKQKRWPVTSCLLNTQMDLK